LNSGRVIALSLPRRERVGPKGRGGGASITQFGVDEFKNAGQISIDVMVPKSKNLETLSLKMLLAQAIFHCDTI
jgi:hypothetical protein